MTTDSRPTMTTECSDLLETLAKHRYFLRFTVRDLTEDQAAQRPTASELCLGGIIRHVAEVESGWVDFIERGPSAMAHDDVDWNDESVAAAWRSRFQMP